VQQLIIPLLGVITQIKQALKCISSVVTHSLTHQIQIEQQMKTEDIAVKSSAVALHAEDVYYLSNKYMLIANRSLKQSCL